MSVTAELERQGSQGAKVVQCVQCKGDIQPYAGRLVSTRGKRYAHHPGQCTDAGPRSTTVRDMARQGVLFGRSCRKVAPAADIPSVCDETGTDRAAYEAHMRAHGLKAPGADYRPIRLR